MITPEERRKLNDGTITDIERARIRRRTLEDVRQHPERLAAAIVASVRRATPALPVVPPLPRTRKEARGFVEAGLAWVAIVASLLAVTLFGCAVS